MVQLSASTTPKEIQASEMLQIESNSLMIIRLVEELLSVSRTLKENWLLNQMPQKKTQEEEIDTDDVKDFKIVKDIMSEILQSQKFPEELSEGEEDEKEEEEVPVEEDIEIKDEKKVVEDEAKDSIQTTNNEKKDEKKDAKTEVKQETSKNNNENFETDIKLEDFNYNAGNNTIDNISNNLNDYNLTDYGNDNLAGLDFDNFGNDDQNDMIMLD